jgi:hypothetical protein
MAGAWIKTVFSVYDKNEHRVQMYSINFNFRTDPADLFGIGSGSQHIRRICSELTSVFNRSAGSVRNRLRFSTDPLCGQMPHLYGMPVHRSP